MCLQSWPRAGSIIRLKVMGHLRDTLIAVCSTESSPDICALLLAATLEKLRLTEREKIISILISKEKKSIDLSLLIGKYTSEQSAFH